MLVTWLARSIPRSLVLVARPLDACVHYTTRVSASTTRTPFVCTETRRDRREEDWMTLSERRGELTEGESTRGQSERRQRDPGCGMSDRRKAAPWE